MPESVELSEPIVTASNVQLRFRRPNFEDLPELALPEGYGLKNYEAGDETGWAAVLRAAFNNEEWTPEKIGEVFLRDDYFKPERVWLATHEGRIVGVASAWCKKIPEEGYVHWVGVDPAHQGKKLGRLVTLAVLHQFKREGKSWATLDTDDFRVAACATYLHLGFQPVLDLPQRVKMWGNVKTALGLESP